MQRAAAWSALRAAARALPGRSFRAAPPVLPADTEALLQLRRRTGLPLLQCREALRRCGGDLPQAEAWLRQQAQLRGWQQVTALGGRQAQQGLLGLVREGPVAAMVEVNCETDFVARTSEFQRVVALAALGTLEHCRGAAAPPAPCTTYLLQEDELAQLGGGPGGGLLCDHIALATGRLREKVALRRAAWLRVPEADGFIGAYAHGGAGAAPAGAAPAGAAPAGDAAVATGSYAALVACALPAPPAGAPPPAALEALGRGLAQHVVGLAPTALGDPRAPPGPPGGEEERRLLAQGYLLQPELSVRQLLARSGGVRVRGFLRWQRGQELGDSPGGDGPGGDTAGDTPRDPP